MTLRGCISWTLISTSRGANILTSVYRKPSIFPTYIPKSSCNPISYKIVTFRALVRRAHTHSTTQQALKTELQHIGDIAVAHGYYNTLVKNLSKRYDISQKAIDQAGPPLNIPDQEKERIPITYNPILKSVYNMIAKRRDMNIAYRRCQTVYIIQTNGKDRPNPERLPGVYAVPLEDKRYDRQLTYIGSTKRSLKVRLKEHESDIQQGRYTTSLATYTSEQEIIADLRAAKIIKTNSNPQQLKWLEAMEIFKVGRNNTCINYKEEMALSIAWKILLNNSV
ncbi:uncharacterized protein LOC111626420 [Centruroides sculpturatus]|uniref:uncharacterized protein LOC111626420 n=1 Tax=Centruroides sculpturatus TaxID=218467 RepID=UPI000C6EC9B1|nr:uncharacterized protein LOC111626420 [Centruroides sculpturatus]